MNRFEQTVAASMGVDIQIHGRVYEANAARPAVAQVCIDTGAANVTFYPTPEALEALAIDLCDLAESVRLLRQQVAA